MYEKKFKALIRRHLGVDSNRYKHSLGVVASMKDILSKYNIEERLHKTAIIIAYLHDIGYSKTLNKMDFHAIDGFRFLEEEGYKKEITVPILFHTYSHVLAYMKGDIRLQWFYKNEVKHINEDILLLINLISMADMQTDSMGINVGLEKRVEDIGIRYPIDSEIYNHAIWSKKAIMEFELFLEETNK